MHRRSMLLGAGATLGLASISAHANGVQTLSGHAFGSTWSVAVPQGVSAPFVGRLVNRVVQSVDLAMSPFQRNSELSRFNESRAVDWAPATAELVEVVDESLAIARLTDGAFDPAVGPVVNRFGYGPVKGSLDGHYREFGTGREMLRKTRPDITLDLCGIAKGYALDRIGASLVGIGLESFFVELGGEVLARGAHPSGRKWRAAIATAAPAANGVQRIVTLDGVGLATSGSMINGGQVGAVKFNHIVDPSTRSPVQSALVSVSVIDKIVMRADALATALYVMGSEQGLELAKRHNIAVLFQVQNEAGISELVSERFAEYIIA